MKRALLAALLIVCSPALAQWQVPDHNVPIGRGAGTGFKFSAPGAAGTPFISNGPAADPSFSLLPLASGVTGVLPLANGGTAQSSAAAARGPSGLNIDQMTTIGDVNAPIAATTRVAATSATLTSPRTWTLPAASTVNAGQSLIVTDQFGAINGANTLTVQRAGSDTINGDTSAVLTNSRQQITLISDGVSRWSYPVGGAGGGGSADQVTYTAPGPGAVASNVGARLNTEIQLIDFWTNTADDTANFQAALDYAATIPNGATVSFCKNPANNHWRITAPIYVKGSKVILKGCGKGSLLLLDGTASINIGGDFGNIAYHSGIQDFTIAVTTGGSWSASATVFLINTSRAFVNNIQWFGWSRVAVWNGITTANGSASGTQFSNLVGVAADSGATSFIKFGSGANTGDFTLTNIHANGAGGGAGGAFFQFGGTGVAQVDGISVSGFLGTSFDYGILASVETGGGLYTATFTGGTFDTGLTTNGNIYIPVSGGTVQNLVFSGVNFASYAVNAGLNVNISATGGTVEGVSIVGGHMYDSGGHGVSLTQSSSGVMRGITISGVVIKDGSRTATNSFDAIIASGNISGLAIANNVVMNNAGVSWRYGINLASLNVANVPSIVGNNISAGTSAVNLAEAQQRLSSITANAGPVSGASGGGNPQFVQAYLNYNITTSTIIDSYNIASVVKNSAGQITITLVNPTVAGFAISATAQDFCAWTAAATNASTVTVRTGTTCGGAQADTPFVSVVMFGRRSN